MSPTILKCVLAHHEHVFDFSVWPTLAKKLKLKGARNQYVLAGRYVDDLILVSPWFCSCCVDGVSSCIYSKVIQFDVDNDGLLSS